MSQNQGNAGSGGLQQLLAKKNSILWGLAILIPVLVMLVPTSETFTAQLRTFFAVTSFVICLWAFEVVNFLIPALLLPVLYILLGLVPPPKAFFAWSIHIPWLVIGGMILTNICDGSGLLKRFSYWSILKVGGTYRGILYGLMLSGIVVALIMPDIASRVIMYSALCYGICKSLGLEPKTKASSGIMLGGLVAALTPSYIYLTSAAQTLIVYEIAGRSGVTLSWMQYLMYNGLPTLVFCFVSVMILDLFFKPENPIDATKHLAGELKSLGKLSMMEKKLIVILLLLVIAVLTSSFHKVAIGWLFVLAVGACYMPGINIGTQEHAAKANYPLIIFVVTCITIGVVSNVLGAGKYIADLLYPYIAGGQTSTMVSSWFLAVVLNFVMTPLAAVSSVTDPLVNIIQTAGLSPYPILYAWNQGLEQIILPYEYALVLFACSYGYISLNHLMKYFGIRMALNLIFLLVVCTPFWKLFGIA